MPPAKEPDDECLAAVPSEEWTLFLADLDRVAAELEERSIVFDPDLHTMAEWVPRYSSRSNQVNRAEFASAPS